MLKKLGGYRRNAWVDIAGICKIPVNHYLFASQGKDTVFYWHCQPVTICDRFLVRCILY